MSSYYVDTAGDNENSGESALLPWATIAYAQGELTGDQSDNSLLFKRGCTWREQFTVGAYGTAGHVFTIGKYGTTGADPIISGADLVTSWTPEVFVPPEKEWTGNLETETSLFTTEFSGKTVDTGCTVTVQSGVALHGTYSGMVTFDGTHTGGYAYKTFDGLTGTTYFRFYFQLSSDFDAAATWSIFPLMKGLGSATTRFSVTIISADPRTSLALHGRIGELTDVGSTPSISVNTPYCVEVMWVEDASVGGLQWWLNGVSQGSTLNTDTAGLAVSELRVGMFAGGTPAAVSEVYFDDVVSSASPIGVI
jgi:hypothetical protein